MEQGLAQICLLTDYLTVVKLRIEQNIPKKRKQNSSDYDKGMAKFMQNCCQC